MDRILHNEPRFFENLALRLLEKIGYGVSMGELTQNGVDGGIDGIVNEDILGFSKIYIQAKRFDKGVVGRPEIQKFVGVLAIKPTKKGLFITTSKFSNEAVEFASNLQGYSVVLIDGDRLLDLMLKYKLGVQVKEIKEIFVVDNDFFDDENY
ncbi:MAG: restriction endonuclease [Campylobacter sp.]|nr:restriction endonuclease [Campylobacter sp.]